MKNRNLSAKSRDIGLICLFFCGARRGHVDQDHGGCEGPHRLQEEAQEQIGTGRPINMFLS